MSHFDKAKSIYPEDTMAFWNDFASFAKFGYAESTPDYFALYAPVDSKTANQELVLGQDVAATDTWYIQVFTGDMVKFMDRLDSIDKKPWVAFHRSKGGEHLTDLKIHSFPEIRARIERQPREAQG